MKNLRLLLVILGAFFSLGVGNSENKTENLVVNTTTLVSDSVNNRVGVGTITPAFPFHISSSTGGTDLISTIDQASADANGPLLVGRKARGSIATPTATQSGDQLLGFSARGYGATSYAGSSRGKINFVAAEAWTDAAHGTLLTFSTTATGSTTLSERARITAAGNFGIMNAAPAMTLDVTGNARATAFFGTISAKQIFASTFETPTTADWAVNSLATLETDPTNTGLLTRAMDDATDECVGWTQVLPTGSVNFTLLVHVRPRTGPTSPLDDVDMDLYARQIPNGSAVTAWSSALSLTSWDFLDASTVYQSFSQSIALSALTLTAGSMTQFELCRDANAAGDDLPGDILVHHVMLEPGP